MKGKSYEINIHICTYKKSEYGMCSEAGTPAFRQRFFSQDQRVGTGKYESTGEAVGTAYGRGI